MWKHNSIIMYMPSLTRRLYFQESPPVSSTARKEEQVNYLMKEKNFDDWSTKAHLKF